MRVLFLSKSQAESHGATGLLTVGINLYFGPLTVEELNACLDSEYCSMTVLINSVCFDEVME